VHPVACRLDAAQVLALLHLVHEVAVAEQVGLLGERIDVVAPHVVAEVLHARAVAAPPVACDDPPMKQTSFASLEYAGKKRKTRREKFLGEMERVGPWKALLALI
jgi:hypothetical protein